MNQLTIKHPTQISGIGLHSGITTNLKILPAPIDTGIIFKRIDLPNPIKIPAHNFYSKKNFLSTILEKNGVEVQTTEHLMSAISALEIDNLIIELDAQEIPILDGSAQPYYKALKKAGLFIQDKQKKYIQIIKPIVVTDGDKRASLSPAQTSSFNFYIDFNHQAIQQQSYSIILSGANFDHKIASARTFGFLEEIEKLRQMGKTLGGNLDNAIVLSGEGKILNKDGLRFKNEFVRHKLLDSIGDIALAGNRIIGHYSGYKSGHALNHELLKELFRNSDCWKYCIPYETQIQAVA